MYFATLTEIPILEALMGAGKGKGLALALLLAGPALSLPSMLIIQSAMGIKKTMIFVFLVVIMATITGMLYGFIFKISKTKGGMKIENRDIRHRMPKM